MSSLVRATDQQILELAITKAIKNGWPGFGIKPKEILLGLAICGSKDKNGDKYIIEAGHETRCAWEVLVYQHDFAKALWREDQNIDSVIDWNLDLANWQYHLQQMVKADDPIKYLGENI